MALAILQPVVNSKGKKRGRKPRPDRSSIRQVRVEFLVTEDERDLLDQRAREDGLDKRGEWIREQCGLPAKADEE